MLYQPAGPQRTFSITGVRFVFGSHSNTAKCFLGDSVEMLDRETVELIASEPNTTGDK